MDVDTAAARALLPELADRLEEGQTFDVAHSAAHFDEDEIEAVALGADEVLDGVR